MDNAVNAVRLIPCRTLVLLFLSLYCLLASPVLAEPETALIPGITGLERFAVQEKDAGKNDAKAEPAEFDMLISMMEPYDYAGLDMDRPQVFAAFIYTPGGVAGNFKPERLDLLGFIEEIKHLDKKAWGASIALEKPGLYQFVLEARPWWDEANDLYRRYQVKVVVPAGSTDGWQEATGQPFEILPLTRPFGLQAPSLFSGKVMADGKPLANVLLRMGRVNAPKIEAPSLWHHFQEARSDAAGQFSFILNQPGWWYCEAVMPGAPLKGPQGDMKPVLHSAILWLYVDGPTASKKDKK